MTEQNVWILGARRSVEGSGASVECLGWWTAPRRMQALLAVLAGALFTCARGAEPALLSYEEARAVLNEVSDARKASEAALGRSKDEARAARALGMPDLFVNATEVLGEKTGTLTGTPLGNINFSDNLKGPRSSVNSTWSIYSGGRISATQRALAAGIDAANAELSHTDEDLDVLLASEYFGLELAANVERTRNSVLEQANRQLDRAIRFEQQGVMPRVERLNAQVARDEAAREQVSAERDREIAEASLRRLLHRDTAVGTSTPLFISMQPLKPLAEWLQLAERDNPTLAALAAKRNQAEQGIDLAQSSWKPEVFAFGTYALIRKYQTLVEPDWIAGIGVNFTLVSHEDRASKVSAAREAMREVQSLKAAASTGIATEVESMYRKVEQAREQFNLLDSTIALSEENLRLRERGFAEGQATSLDVSDARNALARSRTARAVAAYDFDIALTQLFKAAGQTRSLPEFIQRAAIRLPQ
jgi:outer membrane protein TolC